MESISNRARSAFKWTLSLRLLAQAFTWLSSLFVIRLLTPLDYSIVAIADMVLMLALQLASAGLGNVLIRQKNLDRIFIQKVLFLLILLNGSLALLQMALASTIAQFYQQPAVEYVLYITALAFIVMPWITVSSNLLARDMNFKSRSQIDFIASLLSSITALSLAYLGFGFWSLILANILMIYTKAIGYNLVYGKLHFPIWQLSDMGAAVKFGLTIMSTSLLFTLFMKVDILIAARFVDATQLGFYAVAIHLALMPMSKVMPLVNEVAYPLYAAIQDDDQKYKNTFCYILRIVTLFSFPFFYGFAVICEELVVLILGAQWQPAALPLQLILLTIPLRIISNLFTPLMKALGYPSTGLIHVSFSLTLTIIAVFLASSSGIVAIAATWLLTTPIFFLFAVYLCASRSKISGKAIFSAALPPFIISILMFITLFTTKKWLLIETGLISTILIIIPLGVLIYVGSMWLFFKDRFAEAIKFRL